MTYTHIADAFAIFMLYAMLGLAQVRNPNIHTHTHTHTHTVIHTSTHALFGTDVCPVRIVYPMGTVHSYAIRCNLQFSGIRTTVFTFIFGVGDKAWNDIAVTNSEHAVLQIAGTVETFYAKFNKK